ncbi:hypothetical protein [Streptomyces sp. SID8499]|uniref:hypothetical protein n=1 Tax=Streptomyces sp. SID8499 TaxID=2706106 RepID=UPI001942A36C|nr:hypothetical protein [Streptomyces sp. SID8499]
MTSTEAGEAGRRRAGERSPRVRHQAHEGISTADFVTTIDVLRRRGADLGGDGDPPG